jgi:hypothetical protein
VKISLNNLMSQDTCPNREPMCTPDRVRRFRKRGRGQPPEQPHGEVEKHGTGCDTDTNLTRWEAWANE